jgi:hypothetical protein
LEQLDHIEDEVLEEGREGEESGSSTDGGVQSGMGEEFEAEPETSSSSASSGAEHGASADGGAQNGTGSADQRETAQHAEESKQPDEPEESEPSDPEQQTERETQSEELDIF